MEVCWPVYIPISFHCHLFWRWTYHLLENEPESKVTFMQSDVLICLNSFSLRSKFGLFVYFTTDLFSIWQGFNNLVSIIHSVKSVSIRSYSGLHFPAFALNTEIQSECGKIRTRLTLNTISFYAVITSHGNWITSFSNISFDHTFNHTWMVLIFNYDFINFIQNFIFCVNRWPLFKSIDFVIYSNILLKILAVFFALKLFHSVATILAIA